MKYFKTFESFKKAYMTKIDLKDFKSIKKGTKVKYMGADAEVLDNSGFVLTLKQDGKKFTVNKSMFDHGGMISEAGNVPSNIEKFAKERGVLRDVKQIARWAEKAGKRITGGTAIGKGYDTLVLDLTYQGAEVYYDTYKGTIKVNGKPVDSWKTFSKAVEESVDEAFIGPFVFNDRMSDEELKAMYNDALNGYANWQKGFEYPKSDYKKVYQEIEKILNKRGVSVDESVTEAEMTKKTFLDLWKETYGENFISEYPAVAKILKNRPNDIDKREISRIWDETYGEDFKEEYPGIWNKLD